MDHESIRQKLSAYLDGAVTPAERLLIERHLEECGDCRNSLYELEKTVLYLRSLGEVEPPPWLAVKVMARIREEAGRESGFLRRLLQLPLRWRVSVEAVALIFLSVTGYLVYRNVSSELPQISPLSEVAREKPAPMAPPAIPSRQLPGERAPEVKKTPLAKPENSAAGEVPRALPEEAPFADSQQEELVPPAPSPFEAPYRTEDKAMPALRMQERSAGKSLAPSDDFLVSEKENRAPSEMARSKAVPSKELEVLRLELLVSDVNTAWSKIEQVTIRFGGVILDRDLRAGRGGNRIVRLPRKALQGYIEQLKTLGNMRGPVSVLPEGEDMVDVSLNVIRDRE